VNGEETRWVRPSLECCPASLEVLTPYLVRCLFPNLAPRRALQLACTALRLSSVEAPPAARGTMWSACKGSVAVGGRPHRAQTVAACLTWRLIVFQAEL
jgi:hypothetical protein